MSMLPDDGDPWASNNLPIPEQKKTTSWTPVGQATDKKLISVFGQIRYTETFTHA